MCKKFGSVRFAWLAALGVGIRSGVLEFLTLVLVLMGCVRFIYLFGQSRLLRCVFATFVGVGRKLLGKLAVGVRFVRVSSYLMWCRLLRFFFVLRWGMWVVTFYVIGVFVLVECHRAARKVVSCFWWYYRGVFWHYYCLLLNLRGQVGVPLRFVVFGALWVVTALFSYRLSAVFGATFHSFSFGGHASFCGHFVVFNLAGFEMVFEYSNLGCLLSLLTLWLFNAAFAVSWVRCFPAKGLFFVVLLVAELASLIVFHAGTLVTFYVGFEAASVCLLVLLLKWGSRHRRLAASLVFFAYTIFGSACMLLGMALLHVCYGSLELLDLATSVGKFGMGTRVLVPAVALWLLGILVKLPAVPVHSWLLRAHVEAPTGGSVVLAGVFLKFGGFALVQFVYPLMVVLRFSLNVVTVMLIWGIVAALLGFARTVDLKEAVAYSSIFHMNISLICLLHGSYRGISGAQFSWLAHGLVAAGLFILVGHLYESVGSRNRVLCSVDAVRSPDMALFSFYFIWTNAGLPGGGCFPGEFLMLLGLVDSGVPSLVGLVLGVQVVFSILSILFLQVLLAPAPVRVAGGLVGELSSYGFCAILALILPLCCMGLAGGVLVEFLGYRVW